VELIRSRKMGNNDYDSVTVAAGTDLEKKILKTI
jgi:hypothetical protein